LLKHGRILADYCSLSVGFLLQSFNLCFRARPSSIMVASVLLMQ
jgi:hypothetical protein